MACRADRSRELRERLGAIQDRSRGLAREVIIRGLHRVIDEQVASVVRATGSEKAAFELIAAAALGAGLLRWQQGIKVLEEATDAAT